MWEGPAEELYQQEIILNEAKLAGIIRKVHVIGNYASCNNDEKRALPLQLITAFTIINAN